MRTDAAPPPDGKPLTGRTVLAITLAAFGTVIAANLTMAWFAIGSFPGLEVANSYVASQQFDARARAQAALGWTIAPALSTGGAASTLSVRITDRAGQPVTPAVAAARLGRATTARQDVTLPLACTGGTCTGDAVLAPGRWRLSLTATAPDGTDWQSTHDLIVAPPS
jgi:nitrogen fixation protein FixH